MDRDAMRHNIEIWDELFGLPWHLRDRAEADPVVLALARDADRYMERTDGPRPSDETGAYRWDKDHYRELCDLVAREGAYGRVRADLMQPAVYDMLKADGMQLPDQDGWTPEEHEAPVIMTRPSSDIWLGI